MKSISNAAMLLPVIFTLLSMLFKFETFFSYPIEHRGIEIQSKIGLPQLSTLHNYRRKINDNQTIVKLIDNPAKSVSFK